MKFLNPTNLKRVVLMGLLLLGCALVTVEVYAGHHHSSGGPGVLPPPAMGIGARHHYGHG